MKQITDDTAIIINIQVPSKTRYIKVKDVGTFMWGRRLSNYMIILFKNGDKKVFNIADFDRSDISQLQEKINAEYDSM